VKRLTEKIRNQKGGALVEFAIVLPLLLVLVFGMIEFSIMFYDKAVITNASREGARAGIVYDFPDRITTGEISSTVSTYCSGRLITFGSTNQETTTVSGSCVNAGDTISVTVTFPYEFLLLPNLIQTLTNTTDLTAVTVMRCE
jgi:Flp pilus assembly protein TadG